jgi:hypothetical protein
MPSLIPVPEATRPVSSLDAVDDVMTLFKLRQQQYAVDGERDMSNSIIPIKIPSISFEENEVLVGMNNLIKMTQEKLNLVKINEMVLNSVQNDIKQVLTFQTELQDFEKVIERLYSTNLLALGPEHSDTRKTMDTLLKTYHSSITRKLDSLTQHENQLREELNMTMEKNSTALCLLEQIVSMVPHGKKMLNATPLTCTVCYDKEINQVLIPCGHLFCEDCTARSRTQCPMCRTNVNSKVTLRLSASTAAAPSEPLPTLNPGTENAFIYDNTE